MTDRGSSCLAATQPVEADRGEVCLIDLEPIRGAEATKRRPAFVVSNDQADARAARLGRGSAP